MLNGESIEENSFDEKEVKELVVSRPEDDSVMVACPIYRGKDYALNHYLRAYNDFTWPHRSLFMVDDTGTGPGYYEHLLSLGIPCDHKEPDREFNTTFIRSWKRITEEAVSRKAKWVASIETDNICPPITLDVLLNIAGFCRAVHVAHGYRWHKIQAEQGLLIGLGCNLILTELLQAIFSQETWYTDGFESELYEYPKLHNMPCIEVYNLLDVRHLDAPDGHEFYHFTKESLPNLTTGRVGERLPIVYKKDVVH